MRSVDADGNELLDPRRDAGTQRALRFLGILALIGSLHVGFLIVVELDRFVRHRTAITKLETEIAATRAEADVLRGIAERISDTDFRERLARRQGFMFPDETRLIVVQDPLPEQVIEPASGTPR